MNFKENIVRIKKIHAITVTVYVKIYRHAFIFKRVKTGVCCVVDGYALNILAETSATELSKTSDPVGLVGQKDVAKKSSGIARDARRSIEKQTGKSVVSVQNARGMRLNSSTKTDKISSREKTN